MVLATKTEIAAIFVNYQACIPFRNTLEYLGHPQPDDDYVHQSYGYTFLLGPELSQTGPVLHLLASR